MGDLIKFRRGLKANLPSDLIEGELAYCTDTRQLYVGTASGNELVQDGRLTSIPDYKTALATIREQDALQDIELQNIVKAYTNKFIDMCDELTVTEEITSLGKDVRNTPGVVTSIKGRTEGKGKVAYVNKTIDEPIAELNGHTLREVYEDNSIDINETNFNVFDSNVSIVNGVILVDEAIQSQNVLCLVNHTVNTEDTYLSLYYIKANQNNLQFTLWTSITPFVLENYAFYTIQGDYIILGRKFKFSADSSTFKLGLRFDGTTFPSYEIHSHMFINLSTLDIESSNEDLIKYNYSLYEARKNIKKKVLTYADIFEELQSLLNNQFTNSLSGFSISGSSSYILTNQVVNVSVANSRLDSFLFNSDTSNKLDVGKYYFAAKARVTNGIESILNSGLRLRYFNGVGVTEYLGVKPELNKWELLSMVNTNLSGSYSRIDVGVNTVSESSQNVKYEVDGNTGIYAINYKYFDELITKEQLDTMLEYYLEHKDHSLYHVSNPEIKTNNKNLFDGELAQGSLSSATGLYLAGYADDYCYTLNYISVSPLSQYTISDTNNTVKRIFLYDKNKTFLGYTDAYTFTPQQDAQFVRIRFYENNITMGNYNPQLEEGLVATQYVPNLNNSISFPVPRLSALDNGVTDMIHHVNGKWYYEKKISDPLTIDGSLSFSFHTDFVGYKQINLSYSQLSNNLGSYMGDKTIIIKDDNNWLSFQNNPAGNSDAPDRFYGWGASYTISISDADSGWAEDFIPQEADIKAYFTAHPYTILYQLTTPVITEIKPLGGPLNLFKSGTLYLRASSAGVEQYNTQVTTDFPIQKVEKLVILNEDGSQTPLDETQAVIAVDNLSFTHPDLTDNDFIYYSALQKDYLIPDTLTIRQYFDPYVAQDRVLENTYYKWNVVVNNGVFTIEGEEL